MATINIRYYKSPVGEMILGAYNKQLCIADWRYRKMRTTIDKRITRFLQADYKSSQSSQRDTVLDQTISQLDEYFQGARREFEIPLLFAGTDFQKKVWQYLCELPYGSTSNYASLAKSMGNKLAVRAVANANGANAISIIVPCHRIIGSNGELVGYAGGLSAKEKLLKLENSLFTI